MQKAAGDIACMASRHRGCEPGGPERKRPPAPEGAGGLSSSRKRGGRPQTKGGTPSGPPLPGALLAPPRPKPCATRSGGRRRPSLPQGRPCSTFGAGRLNFRVRHGTGCTSPATASDQRRAFCCRRGALGAAQRVPRATPQEGRARDGRAWCGWEELGRLVRLG